MCCCVNRIKDSNMYNYKKGIEIDSFGAISGKSLVRQPFCCYI